MTMNLSDQERQQFQNALLRAFRSKGDLQQLTRYHLGQSLDTIVQPGPLGQIVFELIDWTVTYDDPARLLRGALKENPNNNTLRAFAMQKGFDPDHPDQDPNIDPLTSSGSSTTVSPVTTQQIVEPKVLPGALFAEVRRVLVKTDEFQDGKLLKALFASIAELQPIQDRLDQANNPLERVTLTLQLLLSTEVVGQGVLLPVFLDVLRQLYDPPLTRRQELDALYEKIQQALDKQALPDAASARSGLLQANNAVGPTYWVKDSELLVQRAQSVARVHTPQYWYGQNPPPVYSGTAWLIAPRLALTCWHVLAAVENRAAKVPEAVLRRQTRNSLFTFDYTERGEGIDYATASEEDLLIWDQDLDYALVRLADRPEHLLAQRGILPVEVAPVLTEASELLLIQHRGGDPQQSGPGSFVAYSADHRRVRHRAPTAGGTSGAPLFTLTTWQAIAIHREELEGGVREATLLQPILEDIRQRRPDLAQEIEAAQAQLHVTDRPNGTAGQDGPPGGIHAGRIEAVNIVNGVQMQAGNTLNARDLVELVRAIQRGEIRAEEIKTRNLVSGLQFIADPTHATLDQLHKEIHTLRTQLEEAIAAGEMSSADASDARSALDDSVAELESAQPRGNRVVRKLREISEILTQYAATAEGSHPESAAVSKLALVAATLSQIARAVLGE